MKNYIQALNPFLLEITYYKYLQIIYIYIDFNYIYFLKFLLRIKSNYYLLLAFF